jgi:hypothetical protein
MPDSPSAAPLLFLDPLRRARECAPAAVGVPTARAWRRSWRRVYVECILYFCAGYVLYGASFNMPNGDRAAVLVGLSFVVYYVVPLFRLLLFYLSHADDF